MRRPGSVVVALLVALSACGNGGAGTSGPDAPAPTVDAIDPARRSQEIRSTDVLGDVDVITAIGQHRHLEGTSRIIVPVRFEGEGRFRVTGIAVRTRRFEALPVEVIDVAMAPGQRLALQVDLGEPVCDPVHPAADPLVHLVITVDDGPPTAVDLPIPSWLVDELHEERCAQAAVAEQATVRFGAGSADGAAVRTEVVLERGAGREAVALTELTGSVILLIEPEQASEPLARLGRDEAVVQVPVTVTAARCDAHAVSGSTKTFVFHAWMRVGDGDPVRVDLRPDPELEAAMQDAIEACIAGTVTDPRND